MACQILEYSCEGIGAIASAIIAVCAFVLTIFQFCATKKHNLLSVKPRLSSWLDANYVINEKTGAQDFHYKVYLSNIGIGPALIESFDVYVDGEKVQKSGLEKIDEAVGLLFPVGNYRIQYRAHLTKGGALSVDQRQMLVHLVFPAGSVPDSITLEQAKKRIKLKVEYQSIYEDEIWPYDSLEDHKTV